MTVILLPAHANAIQSEHSALSGPPVSPLLHYAVHRRLEMVSVGGSVVTAVSLPHRKGAFVAREYISEHINLDVPIRKEVYYESRGGRRIIRLRPKHDTLGRSSFETEY